MQNLSPACLETTDARIQKAQDIRAQWEDELSSMSVSTEDRMAPRHALRELEKAMPKVSKKIQRIHPMFSPICFTIFSTKFSQF